MPDDHQLSAAARLPVEVLLLIARECQAVGSALISLASVDKACRISIMPLVLVATTMRCRVDDLAGASAMFREGVRRLQLEVREDMNLSSPVLSTLPSLVNLEMTFSTWEGFEGLLSTLLACSSRLEVVRVIFDALLAPPEAGSLQHTELGQLQPAAGTAESSIDSLIFSYHVTSSSFSIAAMRALTACLSQLGSLRRLYVTFTCDDDLELSSGIYSSCADPAFVGSPHACTIPALAEGLSKLVNLQELHFGSSSAFLVPPKKWCCLASHVFRQVSCRLRILWLPVPSVSDYPVEISEAIPWDFPGHLSLETLIVAIRTEEIQQILRDQAEHSGWSFGRYLSVVAFSKLRNLQELRLVEHELDAASSSAWWAACERQPKLTWQRSRVVRALSPILKEQ